MEVRKGSVVVDTEMDYKKIEGSFKDLEKHTEKLIDKFNRQCDSIRSQELAIQKVKDQIETLQLYKDTGFIKENELQRLNELNAKLPLLNSKLSQTKDETNETQRAIKEAFNKRVVGGNIDNIGKKIDKFKTRMTRLIGTAMVFSLIRNQLTSLRNGFISILKSNNQFSGSLNQIKANLMTAFAPIYNACLPAINSLMSALSKLTGTIAMFISGLFGKSLNDAKKDAMGLSKALDKTSASGDKASGSLASFDKLEVVNDNSSGGGGTSGDSGIDYSGEIEYSQRLLDLLNKIKDFVSGNKEEIVSFLFGIAGGLLAIKLGCDGIEALGIGLLVTGIIYTISSLLKYLEDPSWKNFGSIIQGIGVAIIGLGVLFLGVPGIVAGVAVLIVGTIIKYWDKIKAFFQNGINWLSGKSDWVHEKFGATIGGIYDFFVRHLQRGLDYLDLTFTSIKKVFDGIIKFVKGVFTGDWKMAWEGLKQVVSGVWDWISGSIKLVLSGIIDKAKTIASTVGNSIATIFTNVVNAIISAIEKILNTPIKSINKLIGIINKVPGISLSKIPTLNLPRLATGTVIPPRQEFAAILGDQKHGTNIEAPLETIKQANREVLAEFFNKLDGLANNVKEIVFRNLTFVLQMGGTSFQKMVIDAIRMTEKELGKPLFVN